MRKKLFRGASLLLYPLSDYLCIVVSCLSAYWVYDALDIGKRMVYTPSQLYLVCGSTGLLTCTILYFTGAYRKESSLLNVSELRAIIKGVCLAFLLYALATVMLRGRPARYVVFIAFFLCMISLVTLRTILYHLHPIIGKWLRIHKRVLIYGAGNIGTGLYRHLINSPRLNYLPVGFIDDDPAKKNQALTSCGFDAHQCLRVIGNFSDFPHLVDAYRVDFLFVTISGITNTHLEAVIRTATSMGVRVRFIPNLYRAFLHRLRIAQMGPFPLIEEIEPTHHGYRYLKRLLDITVSLLIIPILLPLWIIIAISIKLDSAGPVFFRQQRVGKDGKHFTMYKFRSMYTSAHPYKENPNNLNDPRITRIGRLIRITSLDEMPQLLNVMKGDMSLVGPRPEMPFLVKQYNEFQQERLRIRPGITGLWQLSGDRNKAIHENMDYDLYYIYNRSFFLDIAILLETVIFAFKGT